MIVNIVLLYKNTPRPRSNPSLSNHGSTRKSKAAKKELATRCNLICSTCICLLIWMKNVCVVDSGRVRKNFKSFP